MKSSWSFEEGARGVGRQGWALLEPAVLSRAVLAANHVLLAEPEAVQRLRPHAGRRLRVQWRGGPGWLPQPPELQLAITPAGLLEGLPNEAGDEPGPPAFVLEVGLDEAMRALGQGQSLTAAVHLRGDAALATDLAWMLEHLRWDVEADLERLMPPALAHGVAQAARTGLDLAGRLAARLRQRFQAPGEPSAGTGAAAPTPPNGGTSPGPGPR